MKVIFKYKSDLNIEIPKNAVFLSIQKQMLSFSIWFLIDTDEPILRRRIITVGTGEKLRQDFNKDNQYLDTLQDGLFVWHVFISKEK